MNHEQQLSTHSSEALYVSIIVSAYKDLEALTLIIDSLRGQTYRNFEVVVVEDNDSAEFRDYLGQITDLKVQHTQQEDLGIRKARSQNNGILAASGDYLIFIDGDCLLYSDFIEQHVRLAGPGKVLAGKRVNLGPVFSRKLRHGQLKPAELERSFLWRLSAIYRDGQEGHVEAGLKLNPDGFIFRRFIQNKPTNILGCNFSCFKQDMIALNGFDESYSQTPLSDDTDLQWRFLAGGLKIYSCKFVANIFHLFHHRHKRDINANGKAALALMAQRRSEGKYRCEIGLDSH